jgi:hypothetical protein
MAEVNLLPPVLDSSNFAPPSASFTESERERRQSNSAFSGEARPAFDPEKAFGDSGRRGSRSASDASSTGGAGREELKKANQGKEGLGGMVEEEEDEPSKGTDAGEWALFWLGWFDRRWATRRKRGRRCSCACLLAWPSLRAVFSPPGGSIIPDRIRIAYKLCLYHVSSCPPWRNVATSEPAEPTPTPSSNPSAALDEAMPSTPPLAIKVKRDVNSTQMALTPGLDDTPFKFGDK